MAAGAWVAGVAAAACAAALALARRRRHRTATGALPADAVLVESCPRCGARTPVERVRGACAKCGVFLHVDWGDEPRGEHARGAGVLRFACPRCRLERDWPQGETVCPGCRLHVRVRWNVHATGAGRV